MPERPSQQRPPHGAGAPGLHALLDRAPPLARLSPLQALQEAHGLPMLGLGRLRLIKLLAIVAGGLAREGHAGVEEQLLALSGRLASRDRRPEAVTQLMDASRMAARRGAGLLAVRHRLAAVVALARIGRPDAARARLGALALAAAGRPPLADAWRHACLVCERGDVREHGEALLSLLVEPSDHHLRYDVLVKLADLHLDGGDGAQARALLAEAGALARLWGDQAGSVHAEAMRGNLLVEAGLLADARAVLEPCVDGAVALEDDLTVLAEGTILTALHLSAGDWDSAARLSRILLSAAERRGNWLGIADAAMSWSTALLRQGQDAAAVRLLVRVGGLLQSRGAAAAFNLLKARLAELRAELGPETMDTLLDGA